ncbi:hypothetical protein BD410DRAFT_809502 [Rickenella mellea]|uniref:Uncharacterized protein n=1 Tax=Rickenella mellea TaxID=50990 RepID=A0A4Y7PIA5_9AGAM|nr:hypothetical protein BD410DRAFT_809502 [Rickenella mellea]
MTTEVTDDGDFLLIHRDLGRDLPAMLRSDEERQISMSTFRYGRPRGPHDELEPKEHLFGRQPKFYVATRRRWYAVQVQVSNHEPGKPLVDMILDLDTGCALTVIGTGKIRYTPPAKTIIPGPLSPLHGLKCRAEYGVVEETVPVSPLRAYEGTLRDIPNFHLQSGKLKIKQTVLVVDEEDKEADYDGLLGLAPKQQVKKLIITHDDGTELKQEEFPAELIPTVYDNIIRKYNKRPVQGYYLLQRDPANRKAEAATKYQTGSHFTIGNFLSKYMQGGEAAINWVKQVTEGNAKNYHAAEISMSLVSHDPENKHIIAVKKNVKDDNPKGKDHSKGKNVPKRIEVHNFVDIFLDYQETIGAKPRGKYGRYVISKDKFKKLPDLGKEYSLDRDHQVYPEEDHSSEWKEDPTMDDQRVLLTCPVYVLIGVPFMSKYVIHFHDATPTKYNGMDFSERKIGISYQRSS